MWDSFSSSSRIKQFLFHYLWAFPPFFQDFMSGCCYDFSRIPTHSSSSKSAEFPPFEPFFPHCGMMTPWLFRKAFVAFSNIKQVENKVLSGPPKVAVIEALLTSTNLPFSGTAFFIYIFREQFVQFDVLYWKTSLLSGIWEKSKTPRFSGFTVCILLNVQKQFMKDFFSPHIPSLLQTK